MPGPDTVAEGAGPAILLTLTIIAFLKWQTARGMGYIWKYTIGALMNWMAGALNIHAWFIHWDIGGPLRSVSRDVEGWFMDQAAQNEAAMGYFWHATAEVSSWMAAETVNLANDTLNMGKWLKNVFTPAYVEGATHLWKSLTHSNTQRISHVETQVKTAQRAAHSAVLEGAPAAVAGHLRPIDREIAKQRKAIGAAAAAGAIGVAHPGGLTGELEALGDAWGWTRRNLRLHNLRLSRLEKLLGAAGIAAVMANALGLPNWRCITRGNLGRVSRAICGLSTTALQDLLGLLVDALILVNICEVITLMEDGLSLIEGPLNDWIATADAMFVHCNYDLPAPLPAVPLSLPPVTGVVLSLPA